MDPVEWLTVGLLIFAGVQLIVQIRAERARRDERSLDQQERIERAFQYAWAEYFRFESLADALERFDLIELALLDVLRPTTLLPHDPVQFMRALAESSRESGVLGGVALGVLTDLERTVGIFTNSVKAYASDAPAYVKENKKPEWVRETYGDDLEPWEQSVRKLTRQVALLMWDAASHNPTAKVQRTLDFADEFASDLAATAVKSLVERSKAMK